MKITLTNDEFDDIVNEVLTSILETLEIESMTDHQEQELSNITVHANNRANGYDENGNKL